ncbi:MAG: LemA family protein [Verrucomicrobiota bacterium]
MKIYLCKKCNQTVPLGQIAEHRRQCGTGSEIALKRGFKSKAGSVFKSVFMAVLAVALIAGGIVLGRMSFSSVAQMRQLERIPATVVNAVLPGEINIQGQAQRLDRTLKAPRTGSECLYYRYLVERKKVDSDGDVSWVTERDVNDSVDFILADATGSIVVRPDNRVKFSTAKSYSTTSGNRRYSEWRIEPGDSLFVFGYVQAADGSYEVRFDQDGFYDPIISTYGEKHERVMMACSSLVLCWGGLVALAFAVALIVGLLRIHRLLVFFTILGMVIVIDLVFLGLKMMKSDLEAAVTRIEAHEEAARDVITKGLADAGIAWSGSWSKMESFSRLRQQGLSEEQASRLSRIRLDVAAAIERVRMQRNAFPERLLAPLWGIPGRDSLPLPAHQQDRLEEMTTGFEKAAIPGKWGLGIAGGGLVAAAVSFVLGFRKVRFKRCMENLPTSSTAGASYGLSEFKGIVALPEDEEPLQSPLTFQPCVEYTYKVEERRGVGKNAKWVTVVDEDDRRPFLCLDSEGSVLVDPDGADVISSWHFRRRKGKYRYSETRLEVNDPLYAIGECVIEPSTGDRLYLKDPDGSYPYILSNYIESTVMRKVAAKGVFLLTVSFAAIVLMTLTLFGFSGSFAATDYLAAALSAPLFMIFITLVLHFNDLVFLRERVERNLANIDVSLKKRHDLIPNLEKVVKTYMEHESGLQEAIAEMRGAYDAGVTSGNQARGEFMEKEYKTLSRVLGVYENYPDLKANRSAAYLMRALVLLENEISFMRNGYNDAVETYNTRTQSLPDLFFAKIFGFGPKPFIRAKTSIVRMPPSIQNLWEKDKVAATRGEVLPGETSEEAQAAESVLQREKSAALAATSVEIPEAGERQPEDMEREVTDARAVIYALLLNSDNETRNEQVERIVKADSEEVAKKVRGLVEAVGKQITDEVNRLQEAEKWFAHLMSLSPGGYRAFKKVVRSLIEQDAEISFFEYALQKSITRNLDASFGMDRTRPARHRHISSVVRQVSVILSRLAYSEDKPEETARDAFNQGVAQLNHEPKTDFELLSAEKCTLALFDEALDELAYATNMIKANVTYACREAVKLNKDYTYDQALLLIAVSDVLGQKRPDWVFPPGENNG